MKTWILAAVMVMGVTLHAQDRKMKQEPLKPEQRVELHTKEMTLALDLNDKQQKDVKKLLSDRATKAEQFRAQHKANKEAGKEATADERFAMKSQRLDEQIAMKKDMKKILTTDQFAKWEKMEGAKHPKMHKAHARLKKHSRK